MYLCVLAVTEFNPNRRVAFQAACPYRRKVTTWTAAFLPWHYFLSILTFHLKEPCLIWWMALSQRCVLSWAILLCLLWLCEVVEMGFFFWYVLNWVLDPVCCLLSNKLICRKYDAGSSNHPTALSTNFCQFLSKFYLLWFWKDFLY